MGTLKIVVVLTLARWLLYADEVEPIPDEAEPSRGRPTPLQSR